MYRRPESKLLEKSAGYGSDAGASPLVSLLCRFMGCAPWQIGRCAMAGAGRNIRLAVGLHLSPTIAEKYNQKAAFPIFLFLGVTCKQYFLRGGLMTSVILTFSSHLLYFGGAVYNEVRGKTQSTFAR